MGFNSGFKGIMYYVTAVASGYAYSALWSFWGARLVL